MIRKGMGCLCVAAIVMSAASAAVRAEDTGVLKGKVLLSANEKPKRTNMFTDIKTDAKCAELYPGDKPQVGSEQVIAKDTDPKQDKAWLLQNAIVYLSSPMEGKTFPAPTEKKTLDQKGCLYHPHVMTMQVEQTLTILNSDPFLHNINAAPEKNPPFNVGQPQAGMTKDVVMKKPEIFKVKCDVHKWMGAYIGVFAHPFHTVTNEKGEFEIKGIPAGEWEFTAWHEVYGVVNGKVTIKAGDNTHDFTFKAEGTAGK